jgi:hypothetical protein
MRLASATAAPHPLSIVSVQLHPPVAPALEPVSDERSGLFFRSQDDDEYTDVIVVQIHLTVY